MMAKPMKAQTESADPVLNKTDYISKLKKMRINKVNGFIICRKLRS